MDMQLFCLFCQRVELILHLGLIRSQRKGFRHDLAVPQPHSRAKAELCQ